MGCGGVQAKKDSATHSGSIVYSAFFWMKTYGWMDGWMDGRGLWVLKEGGFPKEDVKIDPAALVVGNVSTFKSSA